MSALPPSDHEDFARSIRDSGFRFVAGADMRAHLLQHGSLDDWDAFAASWNDLAPDAYLAQVGRHRRRRHAVFHAGRDGTIERQPHQPHYQALSYNALQGDIERWFEPLRQNIADGASLGTVLGFCRDFFSTLAPRTAAWRIELHQFRIEAGPDREGQPTPEGVHRDGVDYVLVLLIDRHNILSGTTTIHDRDGTELGSFTLIAPLDAALVDDARVFHGVTAVTPQDPSREAHRDVLVVTFRAQA
ncbi:2OG-Fe dioxygenase family protein [Lysobacter enzymogenes]|uniref:2OG-Fe dioxygenase family protein n=1 Tax=Lysobacter enzymogenes TaxID=69 RepID=UPI00099CDF05|nr:2OG-Fe dioxygenase family protein [Lysobacter enzymogenes]UZW60368.1 2OG-Fe dioxygenase family protein [Lysobacter enzymogenes]